ncbi:hypothetical protein ACTJJ0_17365 [Chitinophaga sp. 22321]|nr:hypothetical protein [Chitinophaga hostae]
MAYLPYIDTDGQRDFHYYFDRAKIGYFFWAIVNTVLTEVRLFYL